MVCGRVAEISVRVPPFADIDAFIEGGELGWLKVNVCRQGQQVDLRLHFGPPDRAAQEATPSVCWNVIRSPASVEPSQPAAIPTGAMVHPQ